MQILVNSDHHIRSSDSVAARVESMVGPPLERFSRQITRIEVYLKDVNGPKHGDRDKQCTIEAHVSGTKPIAASHEAPALIDAIEGAAAKLERALDHALARLRETAGPAPRDAEIASVEELQELELQEREKRKSHSK
jgi:ribosome-associated translation inhibitor RaiA